MAKLTGTLYISAPFGTITIDETMTGEPGTDAAVENTGTSKDAVLRFTIPRGEQGEQGEQGPQGESGEQGSQGVTYTPAVSAAGVISWTNDGGRENPESVDLVAAVIAALPVWSGGEY